MCYYGRTLVLHKKCVQEGYELGDAAHNPQDVLEEDPARNLVIDFYLRAVEPKLCKYRRIYVIQIRMFVSKRLSRIFTTALLYLKGLYKFRTMFAPSQIYILLGATGVLLRLLFATTLRLAYGIRLLGATDPWHLARART